jgi:hypothetical protein
MACVFAPPWDRYGHVQQPGPSDQHENELRVFAYYQLR